MNNPARMGYILDQELAIEEDAGSGEPLVTTTEAVGAAGGLLLGIFGLVTKSDFLTGIGTGFMVTAGISAVSRNTQSSEADAALVAE